MALTHIVLFQFKPEATSEQVRDTSARMLALKDQCVHPTSQKPYIISSRGGSDRSIEGAQDGISQAFVVEFGSVEDRDYYVKQDPAHREFVQRAQLVIQKLVVVDFTDGVFDSVV